jgi:predicted small integral membrane protein
MDAKPPDRSLLVVRFSKALLVGAISVLYLTIGLNNLIDYNANFLIVRHVMTMDTVPTKNPILQWRAISSVLLLHLAYGSVILAETATGALCGVAAIRCLRSTRKEPRFRDARTLATIGLTIGSLLWLLGFLTIGGEWFVMWQSPAWNGQASAERMFIVTNLVLLFVCQSESQGH